MIYKFKSLMQGARSFSDKPRMLRYALSKPHMAVMWLTRTGSCQWIKRLFDSFSEYKVLVAEIESSDLLRTLNEKLSHKFANISGYTSRGNPFITGALKVSHAMNVYALIRKYAPKVLVETGVCNGFSTAIILAALEKNGVGHLHSIDFPEFADARDHHESFWYGKGGAVVPADEKSGWLVPDELRNRWSLVLGKSRKVLRPLLCNLGQIDLFLHDSEHSSENQLFEFRAALEYLTPSGILLASDINSSDAFTLFWEEAKKTTVCFFIDHSLAIVIKR